MIDFIYIRILLLLFVLKNVNSMSIVGPVSTRYYPCGVGAVYFDKVTDTLWQGALNLVVYQQTGESEIEVCFKQQVMFYTTSQNSVVGMRNNWHDFVIKPMGVLPTTYTFYISINEPNPENVPVVTKFSFNNVTLCDESIKRTQTIASLNVTKKNDTRYRHVCGRRSLEHAELNTLRTEARAGDWPWHVAILVQYPGNDEFKYQCGGNIISNTAILTAGHCLFLNDSEITATMIRIEAGVSDLRDINQVGRQSFVPQRIILHPGYDVKEATSDLAILIVKPFSFTEYLQPICIWGPVYDKTALYGKEAAVVGFGTTEQNKLSDTLRATNIMVQNDSTCLAYSQKLYKPLLNEFTFCAGFGPNSGINPRNGDSGGGLVVPTMQSDHKISWFLRGVLSKCGVDPPSTICNTKYYVVYTDVGPHYSWIYHNSGLGYRSNIVH